MTENNTVIVTLYVHIYCRQRTGSRHRGILLELWKHVVLEWL